MIHLTLLRKETRLANVCSNSKRLYQAGYFIKTQQKLKILYYLNVLNLGYYRLNVKSRNRP